MKKPAKRPVAKKRRRPQPATRVKLKKLTPKQVEQLQQDFACVPSNRWWLVADARGRSVKVKPRAAAPVGAGSVERVLATGSGGTVEVLFAVVQRTDINQDG